jgi:hypothetical protein
MAHLKRVLEESSIKGKEGEATQFVGPQAK